MRAKWKVFGLIAVLGLLIEYPFVSEIYYARSISPRNISTVRQSHRIRAEITPAATPKKYFDSRTVNDFTTAHDILIDSFAHAHLLGSMRAFQLLRW